MSVRTITHGPVHCRAGRSTAVLFLAPFEPWCRENGSSVVIADLLGGLAELGREHVHAIFLRNPPKSARRRQAPALDGVTLGVEPLPQWFSVPIAVGTGRSPWWEVRFWNRKLARQIEAGLREAAFVPSAVHVEHLVLVEIGEYIARRLGVPLVYRAHNIESQLWSRRLGNRGPLLSAFLRHLERRELAAIRRCDLTLCISDVDRNWVHERAPEARADVLPVGLATDRFVAARALPRDVVKRLCFVGGLEWVPNEVGLRWFVDHVLPGVLEAVPDARLAVLARGAADRAWLTDHPAIDVLPPGEDAVGLFSTSRVSIAPLMDGGGVRVKVLESLAAGCPVVATSIGGEGLSLDGLTHADEPMAFGQACVAQLLAEETASRRSSVHNATIAKHGARNVARSLMNYWNDVASGATAFA